MDVLPYSRVPILVTQLWFAHWRRILAPRTLKKNVCGHHRTLARLSLFNMGMSI
jgi:hypothetical protein